MTRDELIPPLVGRPCFAVERANLDKIELEFCELSLSGENASYGLQSLVRNASLEIGGYEQPLFRSWNSSRRPIVETAYNSRSLGGYLPVFEGRLIGQMVQQQRVQFKMDMKLNVTRAIMAQRILRRLDRPGIRRGAYTLLQERRQPDWQGEILLANGQNVLLGPESRFAYASSKPASAHLIDLVEAFETTLVDALFSAARSHDLQADGAARYSLKDAEVYWEFDTPNPLSMADLLGWRLSSVVNRTRTTRKPVILPTSEVIQQSKSVQLDLGNDMRLRLYAKTNRRIRFEVMFGRDAIAKAIGQRRMQSRSALASAIDTLVERASKRLTDLSDEMSPPRIAQHATSSDLLRMVDASHRNRNVSALLLDSLRQLGHVVPEGNPDLLRAAKYLKRRGVLRIVRQQQSWYGLTPQYEAALAELVWRSNLL